MKKLIVTTFAALSAGATFANIASVDKYMEVNWFENAITSTFPEGWSGTNGQATIADNKMTIDAETAVTFIPPAKTGTVVSQIFDIDPEPVSELPEVADGVQTGLVVLEEAAGLAFYAYARTTADGTAAWLKLSGTPSEDGQKIAIEADYETTPAKLKFLLVDDKGTETELKVADDAQLYAANDAKTVTAYDFTGSGTLASLTGTQTDTVAAIYADKKYHTLDEALAAVAKAEGSITDLKLVASITELPEGYGDYKIVDGKIVAKVYIAQVGETKYESFGEALAQGGTVKLLADLTVDAEIAIVKPTTLDLGGHTLTSTANDDGDAIWVKGIADNSLTITNGTVSGTQIGVYVSKGAKLTVAADATIETTTEQAIFLAGGDADIAGTVKAAKDAVVIMAQTKEWNVERASTVTVSGTIIAGTNGALLSFGEDTNEHVVTILEGATLTVTSETDLDSAAIYWPSAGTLTVEGGTLTAAYAVQQRSGAIALNGGTLNGKVVIEDGKDGSAYPAGTPAATIAAGLVAAEDLVVIARDGYESAWTMTEGGLTLGFTEIVDSEPLESAVASELIAAGKTTVKLADGATFTYDQVPEVAQAITIKTEGTVKVVGDAETKPVVNNISVAGEGGALIFENVTKTYTAYPTADECTMLKDKDAWKNCVAVLKDITEVQDKDKGTSVNEFGNETSVVRFDGCKFWIPRDYETTVTVDLVGAGLWLDGMSTTITGAGYKFAKITGDGQLKGTDSNGASTKFTIIDATEFAGNIDTVCALKLNGAATVAEGKTFKASTIEVADTLVITETGDINGTVAGTGTVDVTAKAFSGSSNNWAKYGCSTSTIKIGDVEGHIEGADATLDRTVEIAEGKTLNINGGYSGKSGTIKAVKGAGTLKVTTNLAYGYYTAIVKSLEDFTGTLEVANKSSLIVPNGATVTGAKAKAVGEETTLWSTSADKAIEAAQTGTTATGVTIFDATGVTVPAGYVLAADGTLTRKLYWNGNTGTDKHIDWYKSTLSSDIFVDANDAALAYTEGDTILLKTSKAVYLHNDAAGLKFGVVNGANIRFVRPGSTATDALDRTTVTIEEGATVTLPRWQNGVNDGWDTYQGDRTDESVASNATIGGAGTFVAENGATVVLKNTTIAETVTVKIDEGATIIVEANSSMPEPVLGTTTTADVKVLTSTKGGVTTYTVGVEQGEEWTDVTDDKPISDVVPAEQAAALEAAGATTKAVVDWAKAHAAGTKPGDAISLEAFALDLDNTATEEQIAEAAKNLTVTIEMVDGVAKASVVLKNGLKVNVEPVMKGKANLSDKDWSDDLTGKKFFKAFIDL